MKNKRVIENPINKPKDTYLDVKMVLKLENKISEKGTRVLDQYPFPGSQLSMGKSEVRKMKTRIMAANRYGIKGLNRKK